MSEENIPQEKSTKDDTTSVTAVKATGGVFLGLSCCMLELILGIAATPIGFFILYCLIFQPKLEAKFPKRHETRSNISCSEHYKKQKRDWVLSGEINHFGFPLKDGVDETAGIFAYEGDLHVRINGIERRIVHQGVLDETAKVCKPSLTVNVDDPLEVKGRKWGLTLAGTVLMFFNTKIMGIEGVTQAFVFIPLVEKPGGKKVNTFILNIEPKSKDVVEFSTDSENWHPFPFPADQIERIFGPLLDAEELKRREELRAKKAEELKEQWKRWKEAVQKGKEKIEDVKENIEHEKKKMEQGIDKGKALIEKRKGFFKKEKDEAVADEP